jgi:hypothetical protein
MAAKTFVDLVSGQLTVTAGVQVGGAGNADKIPALNAATGLLDVSMLPATIIPDQVTLNVGTTTIADGDLVYETAGGVLELAKADSAATLAQGFVAIGDTTGNPVVMGLSGSNTGVSGLTVGAEYYLSAATAGKITATPPSGPNLVQPIGFAVSATRLHFHPKLAVLGA